MLAEMAPDATTARHLLVWRIDESEFLGRLYDLKRCHPRPKVHDGRTRHLAAPREQPRLGQRLGLRRPPLRARDPLGRQAALLPRQPAPHCSIRPGRSRASPPADYILADRQIRQVSTISGRPSVRGGPATPRNIQPHTLRQGDREAIRNEFKAYDVEAYCDEIRMPPVPPNSYARPGSRKATLSTTPCRLTTSKLSELCRTAAPTGTLSRRRTTCKCRAGVAGAPKNIIFASDGTEALIALSRP